MKEGKGNASPVIVSSLVAAKDSYHTWAFTDFQGGGRGIVLVFLMLGILLGVQRYAVEASLLASFFPLAEHFINGQLAFAGRRNLLRT